MTNHNRKIDLKNFIELHLMRAQLKVWQWWALVIALLLGLLT